MSQPKDKYTILAVDDDTVLLDTLAEGLVHFCSFDVNIVKAIDGVEALKLCEGFDFDAIITDFFMPNMDGMQFIKEFKAKSKDKTIPIIFTSAYFSELETDANKHLFEDVIFIDKPYKFSKINSFLKLYLQSEKLSQKEAM